jgi:hypothetical protein
MFTTIQIDNRFTIIPNDLYLVLDNGNEALLLLALIEFQGTNAQSKSSCHASISTLSKRIITKSRNKTEKTIQSLKNKGYINYIKGNTSGKANEYSVNMGKIISDIKLKRPFKDVVDKATKELNDQQKDAMATRRVSQNKNLLIKANSINNIQATDKLTGEILN